MDKWLYPCKTAQYNIIYNSYISYFQRLFDCTLRNYIPQKTLILLHVLSVNNWGEAETKCPQFCRRHFKLIFSAKAVAFWFKFAWSLFLGYIRQYSGVSDNGWETNKWRAIILTKYGLVHWRLTSSGLNYSNHVSKMGPGERRDTTCDM